MPNISKEPLHLYVALPAPTDPSVLFAVVLFPVLILSLMLCILQHRRAVQESHAANLRKRPPNAALLFSEPRPDEQSERLIQAHAAFQYVNMRYYDSINDPKVCVLPAMEPILRQCDEGLGISAPPEEGATTGHEAST